MAATQKVNTYIGMLMVTIFAAGAIMLIVHVTFSGDAPPKKTTAGSEASYASLKKNLLK